MILVLAGTKDGREIIRILKDNNKDVMASVVTKYGFKLLQKMDIRVIQKKLRQKDMEELIKANDIETIIDSTHPFAAEVSKNAINACQKRKINYIRFERKKLDYKSLDCKFKKSGKNKLLIEARDFTEAAEKSREYNNILLTIGSKNIATFINNLDKWQQKLVVRILPDTNFISRARKLGITPDKIIAIQGPFSEQMNRVILEDYNIDLLVSKASGRTGGLETKLAAAFSLKIPVIIIKRPDLAYDLVLNSYQELENLIEKGKV